MKTFVSGVFLSLTLTGLMAQTRPEPKKDLGESIKHYQTVSAKLQEVDKRLRKVDSLYLKKMDSLDVTLEKLNAETKRNREAMVAFEKQQIRLKEEYVANMKVLGIQVKLD